MNKKTTNEKTAITKSKILDGTVKIINEWLGCQNYEHKPVCRKFKFPESGGLDLIQKLYERIDKNWREREKYTPKGFSQNWRLTQETKISDSNFSVEKRIEKRIAASVPLQDEWFNQIPVASGLLGPNTNNKNCIDLARHLGGARYEFIELKYQSNDPLFAAMEILLYGLLYIHARVRREEMNYTGLTRLLRATEIGLRVLAPSQFYKPYVNEPAIPLLWLQEVLTDDIWRFAQEKVRTPDWKVQFLQMDFKFLTFELPKNWPTDTKDLAAKVQQSSDEEVKQIADTIKPLYPIL